MLRVAQTLLVLLCLAGVAWAQDSGATPPPPAAAPAVAAPDSPAAEPAPAVEAAAPEPAWPEAPPGAAEAVAEHFAAITAGDYGLADKWFSAAFIRAFKADVQRLNLYYLQRAEQLARGYTIVETAILPDRDRETARITVDFSDPYPESPIQITERIFYYLIREKTAAGAPGEEDAGRAWRIDIFDALKADTLADARRRPYLYTREAWPDDASRELKSRQGLFRIQYALEEYYRSNGHYPQRLYGGDSRRDPLLGDGLLTGAYPPTGYDERAMETVELGDRSSGDFSYYGVDNDGDGANDSYWLVLHGKSRDNGYYRGLDTVYILAPFSLKSQYELAQNFAQYWQDRGERPLILTEAADASIPAAAFQTADAQPAVPDVETGAEDTAVVADAAAPTDLAEAAATPAAEPATDATPAEAPVESTAASRAAAMAAAAYTTLVSRSFGMPAASTAPAQPAAPAEVPETPTLTELLLKVFSFGF